MIGITLFCIVFTVLSLSYVIWAWVTQEMKVYFTFIFMVVLMSSINIFTILYKHIAN